MTSRKIISTDGNAYVASVSAPTMRGAYPNDVFGLIRFAGMEGSDVNAKSEIGSKVLLIDDEMLVRAGTAIMLDELGHDVTEASSGKQALEILGENPDFDLIVSDFRMPEMDGMELIGESRKIIPGLKAVLMTGYEATDSRFAELKAASLNKPFSLADLETAVRKAQ